SVGYVQLQQGPSSQTEQARTDGSQTQRLEGVNRLALDPRFEEAIASAKAPSDPSATPASLATVRPAATSSPSIRIVRPPATEQPRYVIDARPVSFEGTLSF
ncbi:MAG: hypothetical protein SNJ52_04850, partial [Verrucomicrobiia bacterium]